MIGIFFLVAVFNLILGYVLGSLFPPGTGVSWKLRVLRYVPFGRKTEAAGTESAVAAPPRGGATAVREAPAAPAPPLVTPPPPEPVAPPAAPPAPPTASQPVDILPESKGAQASGSEKRRDTGGSNEKRPSDWSELGTALGTVTDRLTYVRSIQDKALTQQAAEAFGELIASWYDEASALLEADDAESTLGDDEMMQLELFVAQLETTAANLKCIDWSDDLDTILARLEKEVRTLEELRPQAVAASA